MGDSIFAPFPRSNSVKVRQTGGSFPPVLVPPVALDLRQMASPGATWVNTPKGPMSHWTFGTEIDILASHQT